MFSFCVYVTQVTLHIFMQVFMPISSLLSVKGSETGFIDKVTMFCKAVDPSLNRNILSDKHSVVLRIACQSGGT